MCRWRCRRWIPISVVEIQTSSRRVEYRAVHLTVLVEEAATAVYVVPVVGAAVAVARLGVYCPVSVVVYAV
jgi:hypothetical protein